MPIELRDDYDEENKDEIVKGLLEMVGLEIGRAHV